MFSKMMLMSASSMRATSARFANAFFSISCSCSTPAGVGTLTTAAGGNDTTGDDARAPMVGHRHAGDQRMNDKRFLATLIFQHSTRPREAIRRMCHVSSRVRTWWAARVDVSSLFATLRDDEFDLELVHIASRLATDGAWLLPEVTRKWFIWGISLISILPSVTDCNEEITRCVRSTQWTPEQAARVRMALRLPLS